MLVPFLPRSIADLLPKEVMEIRLRKGGRLRYLTLRGWTDTPHLVTEAEFEYVLLAVTERSLYAITEKLVNGYLPLKGGVRVGVAGEGVMEGDRVKSVKHISSLAIRIPHQVFGVSDFLVIDGYFNQNVLIVSPPACGKTTLLRDIARRLSNAGKNVVILDERGEISGVNNGCMSLEVGANSDVLFGFPKKIAYVNALRALNPDYVITDELSGESDVAGVLRAFYGGVRVIATLHGQDENALYGDFSALAKVFDRIIVLSRTPRIGTILKDLVR